MSNIIPYGLFIAINKLNLQHIGDINIGDYLYMDTGAKVCDGIYIGSLATATSEQCLDNNNIDAIINLSGSDYESNRPVYILTMDDTNVTPHNMDIYLQKFAKGVEAIVHCRQAGKRVLVHCAAGINRSATLIAFYLIHCGWTYDQALDALKVANIARRVPLLTNDSFRYLLQAHDSFRRNFDNVMKK